MRYAALTSDHRCGVGRAAAEHLREWLRIPAGASALVISSGGSIEPVLTAALPQSDHRIWCRALHQMEGATLVHDGSQFLDLEVRRLDIRSGSTIPAEGRGFASPKP